MDSLLARVTPADIVEEPFPHVVVREPLDAALCNRLIAEFPPMEGMTGYRADASNKRLNYHATDALANEQLSPLWREMLLAHLSQAFLDELLGVFGESIGLTYPELAKSFAETSPRAGVRWVDSYDSADILLEAQPAANTPVTGAATAVRGGHLDNPNKLIVGLYYLRHPDDDSTGGDLQLYRYTTEHPAFEQHEISQRYIEAAKTIPYQTNVLVLFLNSPLSLHGVTPRHPTHWPRLFLNLGAEVNGDLFAIRSGRIAQPDQMRTRGPLPSRRRRGRVPPPQRRPVPLMRAVVQRRPYVAAALLGVALTAVAVATVEALTDRDWAISGLEWPADFLASILLVLLVALGFAASRAVKGAFSFDAHYDSKPPDV
jgi:hypothetical protein